MNTQTSQAAASPRPNEGAVVSGLGWRRWTGRAVDALSAGIGTVAGITPHVLHHIGPIAGAAILTGTEGSVLFGAIGFALTLPLLMKLKRRFHSWAAPGVALSLFVIMFTVSTLWIGPWIRGEDSGGGEVPTDEHHARIQQSSE